MTRDSDTHEYHTREYLIHPPLRSTDAPEGTSTMHLHHRSPHGLSADILEITLEPEKKAVVTEHREG